MRRFYIQEPTPEQVESQKQLDTMIQEMVGQSPLLYHRVRLDSWECIHEDSFRG
jgi:hypothetical protein